MPDRPRECTASAAAVPQLPARDERGVRVELIPARPPRLTACGRIAVPMWVLRDEKYLGDTEMLLARHEALGLLDRLHDVLVTGGPR